MRPDPRTSLVQECVQLHFEHTRNDFKRALVTVLAVAVAVALTAAIAASNPRAFVFVLILISVLAAPIPLAIRYVRRSRIEDFRRKLTSTPGLVSSVLVLAARRGALHRVILFTHPGDQYALWLPQDCAANLSRVYAPGFDVHRARQ